MSAVAVRMNVPDFMVLVPSTVRVLPVTVYPTTPVSEVIVVAVMTIVGQAAPSVQEACATLLLIFVQLLVR